MSLPDLSDGMYYLPLMPWIGTGLLGIQRVRFIFSSTPNRGAIRFCGPLETVRNIYFIMFNKSFIFYKTLFPHYMSAFSESHGQLRNERSKKHDILLSIGILFEVKWYSYRRKGHLSDWKGVFITSTPVQKGHFGGYLQKWRRGGGGTVPLPPGSAGSRQ